MGRGRPAAPGLACALAALAAAGLALPACDEGADGAAAGAGLAVELTAAQRARVLAAARPEGLPPDPTNAWADDDAAAALGHALFFDPRLSADGIVSCASCHDPARDFTDGVPLALGLGVTPRNTPTVWNAAFGRWQFWDGRADSLWAQALAPLEAPAEMGTTRTALARLVATDPALRAAYAAVFGAPPDASDPARFPAGARPVPDDPSSAAHLAWEAMAPADRDAATRVMVNLGKALAAYERRLVVEDAPFDRFVRGLASGDPEDLAALSPEAQRGLARFFADRSCADCHRGPDLTDREFHNIGLGPSPLVAPDRGRWEGVPAVLQSPFNGLGPWSDAAPEDPVNDKLRYLALRPNNEGEMKTPTLRQVAGTAPYMHDGRFGTLEEVLRFYSELPDTPVFGHREETLVPLRLTDVEIAELIAFLEALTGTPRDPSLLAPPGAGPPAP